MNKAKRTLCVGDIHGGLRSFKQVLERCKFSPEEDQLICLGDYVDGWSESAQLIEFLLQLESSCAHKPIFIRGNHDTWCEEWLRFGIANEVWLTQGGEATVKSYIVADIQDTYKHLHFFQKLHNYYIDEKNRGFVHGGFISKNGLGHEHYESDYYWDRDLWNLALLQHNNYHEGSEEALSKARRFEKHKEVFIGHTTTGNWLVKPHLPEYKYKEQPKQGRIVVPMNRCNVWNLDTGGGYEGRLSIIDVDTKEFWQSDDVKTLYPEETGRN